jgi:glycosyltransferase involved in cell wall biosynthesis
VDLILRAAAQAQHRIPGLQIRIVGQGPEVGKLRRICRDHHLEKVVRWVGDVTRSQLAAEYCRANVFCMPSVQEGFGIVFLEAMAAGKPVLAARAAAAPEVVPHGVLVERDNVRAIAEGLEALYTDTSMRRRMCAEGLEIVKQYDAPRVTQLFLSEIEKLLH